jgi:hypothetical protein
MPKKRLGCSKIGGIGQVNPSSALQATQEKEFNGQILTCGGRFQ